MILSSSWVKLNKKVKKEICHPGDRTQAKKSNDVQKMISVGFWLTIAALWSTWETSSEFVCFSITNFIMSFMFGFGFVSVSAMFVYFENALLVNGFKGSVEWVVIYLEFFCEEKKDVFWGNLDKKVFKKHMNMKETWNARIQTRTFEKST
jgi:hypothetical protein